MRALVDLSGVGEGTHTLDVQVQIAVEPVRIVSYSPHTLTLTLEELATTTLPIQVQSAEVNVAVGYEAGTTQADCGSCHGQRAAVFGRSGEKAARGPGYQPGQRHLDPVDAGSGPG